MVSTSFRRVGLLGLVSAVLLGLALTAAPAHAGKSRCTHTVKKGDTLSRIARRYGVTQANLIKANRGLSKNPRRLRVGQTVQICRAKNFDRSRPRKCGDGGRLISHDVRRGETIGGIAARYSVSRKSLLRQNKKVAGRKNNMIRAGETLRVCTKNRRYTHRSWLKGGVQLPEGEGYNVRRPHNAWGTATAVTAITASVARYRALEPDAPLVQIGDVSRKDGGPLGAHMSHQEGRDVDIGYVWQPRDEESGRRKMDLARTWALLSSFIEDDAVKVIFVDYRVQKRLYEYAESIGVAQDVLDRAFQYPRNGDHEAVLYHWRGHTRHFHVRFARGGAAPEDAEPKPGASS